MKMTRTVYVGALCKTTLLVCIITGIVCFNLCMMRAAASDSYEGRAAHAERGESVDPQPPQDIYEGEARMENRDEYPPSPEENQSFTVPPPNKGYSFQPGEPPLETRRMIKKRFPGHTKVPDEMPPVFPTQKPPTLAGKQRTMAAGPRCIPGSGGFGEEAMPASASGSPRAIQSFGLSNPEFYIVDFGRIEASTFYGHALDCYISGIGDVVAVEYYYDSQYAQQWKWIDSYSYYNPGPHRWTTLWFYADMRGWHALRAYTHNGRYATNWVYIYVY